MRAKIKDAVEKVVAKIDEMNIGDLRTISSIVCELDIDIDSEELVEVDLEVSELIDKSRDYILDKSHHDMLLEGLSYNLDFVKRSKEN